MSQQFRRDARVKVRAQFDVVKTEGRRMSMRYLTLQARPNGLATDRLGVIASRRLGGAVVRNCAKRRLREVFRLGEPDQAAARGHRSLDLVAIPRRELIEAPFAVIRTEFTDALKKFRKIFATR
jgi:ribonuclease P protein component